MKIFKNKVGRPSNATIRNRRILCSSIIVVIVIFIGLIVINKDKIFNLKDQMLDYYNNNYDKSATLPREEVAKFAECELYLTAIYTIEAKYKNNKQRIEELRKETNLIPAGKILLSTLRNLDLYSIGYEKNMDNLVEFSINKYEEIMNKYNDDSIEANNETMKQEKEELLKMITYKYKLSDAYNELVFRQDELNENEKYK